jgi:hypothetical protein
VKYRLCRTSDIERKFVYIDTDKIRKIEKEEWGEKEQEYEETPD